VQLEVVVAKRLGISCLYSDQRLLTNDDYLTFLQNLHSYLSELEGLENLPRRLSLHNVKLHITSNPDDEDDTEKGIVRIDCHLAFPPPLEFMKIVEERSVGVSRLFRIEQTQRREFRYLLDKVKRAYCLHSLSYDAAVGRGQVKNCCERLLTHADPLLPHLQVLPVHVSDKYSIGEDGTLSLKWNFEL